MSRQVDLGQIVPNIQVGTTTTGLPSTPASVENVGTDLNPIFNFTIPKGNTGATPNIQIGDVQTGDTSEVTRTGTDENPIFNFTLEKGDTGNGISSITKTSTSGLVDTYTITFTNGQTTTYQITNGANGSVVDVQVDGTSVVDNGIANIVGISEIKQELEDMYNLLPKVSGTGETITLDGTVAGKMLVDLKGNTSQETSILPSEYTQVDYIQSSGTQYIDTGVKLSPDYGFDIKFLTNNVLSSTTGYGCIFGGRNGSGNKDYQLTTYITNITPEGTLRWGAGTSGNIADANITLNTAQQCSLKNKTFTSCNGTVTQLTTTVEQSDYNCFLFGLNNGTSGFSQSGNGCRIYYCKFYDGNNLIRNYVPCYRNSDNEIGLYDLVNNVFYTNTGTGAFTYGSVATLPNPDYPQDIHVVSGDNSIVVCGKNLISNDIVGSVGWGGTTINYEGTSIKISKSGTGGISANAHTNIRYFPLTTGKTYTFSMNYNRGTIVTEGANYGWAFYIFGVFADGSTSGTDGNRWTCSLSKTTTTPSNHITFTPNKDFIGFKLGCYIPGGSPKTDGDVYFDCQVEVGEATTYEPYQSQSYPINLGDIELCKIGDYQDSIVKDNGKWYLKKEIGKYTFTENDVSNFTIFSNVGYNANNLFTNYRKESGTINIISTKYVGIKQSASNSDFIYNASGYNYAVALSPSSSYYSIKFKDTRGLSANDFGNSIIGDSIYYVLATPTYTEITDTTLQQQLNTLEKARSYNSQTNLTQTNDDISFIITATALESITNS